jgi:Spy/CpxP family protein refolding chaperone
MKRFIVFFSLCLALSVTALRAQTPAAPTPDAAAPTAAQLDAAEALQSSGRHYKKLQSELGLSEEQMAKLKTLMQERKAQAEQDKAAAGSDELKRHELTKARMKVYDEKLNAILTAEQQQKYATYKAAMKDRGRERRGKF